MPYPILAGTSNNCALHALTPELCEEIEKYATQPDYDNQHNPEYLRLKDVFAQFYKLNGASFTWKDFDAVLKQYNPFDVQIILGPVLRSFMKGVMVQMTDPENPAANVYHEWVTVIAAVNGVSPDDLIKQYTERSDREGLAGRYCSLTDEELAILVGFPLGLSIKASVQEGAPHNFPVGDSQVALVEIFHTGGTPQDRHWERAAGGNGCEDYRKKESTQLTFLLPLFDETVFLSVYATTLLKEYIKYARVDDEDNRKKLKEVELASQQIQTYFYLVKSVRPDIARGALPKHLTKIAEHFIQKYQFPPVAEGQIVETLLSLPPAHRFSANISQKQALEGVTSRLPTAVQERLKDTKHYVALCDQARDLATRGKETINAIRFDFSVCTEIAAVDALMGRLTGRLQEMIRDAKEGLEQRAHTIDEFPQINAAFDVKLEAVQNAAVKRKRQILLVKMTMEDHIRRFEEKTKKTEDDALTNINYAESARVARAFVTAITAAKTAFERDTRPLDESKRDFKQACLDAINAASILRHHIEWKGAIAKFLIDVLTSLVGGIFDVDKRLGIFAKTGYQIELEGLETDVNNTLLQGNPR